MMQMCISVTPRKHKHAHGSRRLAGVCPDLYRGRWLLKNSKTVNVTVKKAEGQIPADYCNFAGVLDVHKGKLHAVKK
jgi:hypothetical protein